MSGSRAKAIRKGKPRGATIIAGSPRAREIARLGVEARRRRAAERAGLPWQGETTTSTAIAPASPTGVAANGAGSDPLGEFSPGRMAGQRRQQQNVEPGLPASALDLLPDEPSWAAWVVYLLAIEGRGSEMSQEQRAIFTKHTGRQNPPTKPVRESHVIAGRRGGKSVVASAIAVVRAVLPRTWKLRPGEVATIPIISADRAQSATVLNYVKGLFEATRALKAMLASTPTKNIIRLTNSTQIEIFTASFRTSRGRTLAGVICDETAFWRSEETSLNPDVEIFRALRPGLMTSSGPLVSITSPYSRRGVPWEAYKKHYRVEDSPVLIWKASSLEMNPSLPAEDVQAAYEEDAESASAEYGGEFRSDLEAFLTEEILASCTVSDRLELQPSSVVKYVGFVDVGGGGPESMTMGIAHRDSARNVAVLDYVREVRTPYSPEAVATEFAADFKRYDITQITGDRYAGEWPRDCFRKLGIAYTVSEPTKSDIYLTVRPMMTSGTVELLDQPRLLNQFRALERRTARSGKDSISHPPRGMDDIANAASGALALVQLLAKSFPTVSGRMVNEFGRWTWVDGQAAAPEIVDANTPVYGDKKCPKCGGRFYGGTEQKIFAQVVRHWAEFEAHQRKMKMPTTIEELEDWP